MIAIALSLSLAFIMFSLGITLLPRDFRVAALQPRALLAGAIAQVLLLPLVAFALVMLFGMRGELALGVIILSGCPGGVTSNLFTKFAKGDVALSISYTALASVISTLSLPLLLSLSSGVLMPDLNTSVSTADLSLKMITISTLPALLGVVVHQHRPEWCRSIHPWCEQASSTLIALVVMATVVNQWSLFTANLTVLGVFSHQVIQ